jgi:hypothetical protein
MTLDTRCLSVAFVAALVILVGPAVVSAAPIDGSAGSVLMEDGPNIEGLFFKVKVDFEAFDGTSASDPLGVTTGLKQYAFILTYKDGNENVGRFDVESTFGIPILGTGTSTTGTVNGFSPGTFAPTAHGVVTLINGKPAARFLFRAGGQSLFGPAGTKSVILVYTTDSSAKVGLVTASVVDSSLSKADSVIGPVPGSADPDPEDPPVGNGDQGCTPGYWKNHLSRWPAAYSPSDSFNNTFGVNAFSPDITLQAGLNRNGGHINALARHAVAALLSAASLDVDYSLTTEQVILMVQQAVGGSKGQIEAIKNQFEHFNELGCPL